MIRPLPSASVPSQETEPAAALPRASLLAIALVSVAWRLPSLFDPPWVNDEGTYFAVAQAMAHGYRLYRDVWENKPPAIYLVYSAVYHPFGPSLLAVRLLAAACAALIAVMVALIATRFVAARAALCAGLLTALLLGVPFLEGTTANAELFLALCSTLGVYLALGRSRPGLGGTALGAAVLFKAVAVFDLAAVGLYLLLRRPVDAARLALAAISVLALASLTATAAGILPDMVRDSILYDLGYVGRGNGAGVPWLAGAKLISLLALTVALRRKPFPYLWLVYAAAGALISGRFFGHYALQAVAPASLSLVLALGPDRLPRRPLLALPVLFLLLAALCAGVGWSAAATGHDSILVRRLQYYSNFLRWAAHTESSAVYRAQIDDHVNRNLAVVHALRSLPPGRLLIWANTPWVYPLSGRLPATPYTSAWRDPTVPGEPAALRSAIRRRRARVVVVVRPPVPPLGPARARLSRSYIVQRRIADAWIYAPAEGSAP